MSLLSWFDRPRKTAAPRRRPRPVMRLEALEDRVTPAATFNSATGALLIQADKASSNDTVRVQAAGAAADGSTGVRVTSALVKGGAQTFGDAAHPVKQVSLDLKNGNDTVTVGDLTATDVFIGEGDGNNSATVGKTAAAAYIAGGGLNRVTLGEATRDWFTVVRPDVDYYRATVHRYVGIGYGYAFDAGGGLARGAEVANARANVVRLLDGPGALSDPYTHFVDVHGTGSNTVASDGPGYWVSIRGQGAKGNNSVRVGNGDYSLVEVYGDGNNSVTLGDGYYSFAMLTGSGNNRITMGDGDEAHVVVTGGGSNTVTVGDGSASVIVNAGTGAGNGKGNNRITVGDGDGSSVEVNESDGNNTVTVGDGDGVYVNVMYWYTPGRPAAGNNTITVGDGDGVIAGGGGTGNNSITVGDGNDATIAFDASVTDDLAAGTYGNSRGKNRFVMGNGDRDRVLLTNSDGENYIRLGNGDGDEVSVYAVHEADFYGAPHVPFSGKTTVVMGDGSGGRVVLDKALGSNSVTLGSGDDLSVFIDGIGGTGVNVVRAGDGANVSVTLKGDGVLSALVGRGTGASIDVQGAGVHVIDARNNTAAKIRNSGLGGGLIAAALGSDLDVNGLSVTTSGVYGLVAVRFYG